MPRLVIVADDLTGAADTGACFAAAGLVTVIGLSDTMVPNADVAVVTTESRDLDGAAAGGRPLGAYRDRCRSGQNGTAVDIQVHPYTKLGH